MRATRLSFNAVRLFVTLASKKWRPAPMPAGYLLSCSVNFWQK